MSRTLISILAGLGSMFGWGVSDFFASLSTDKVGHVRALFWSQLIGIVLIASALVAVRPAFDLTPWLLLLVVISAVGHTIGYLHLYKAYEIGNASVVSVVINFQAVLTMTVVFLLFGQRLSGWQIPGAALIIAGIMLVSVDFQELFARKNTFLLNCNDGVLASAIVNLLFHKPRLFSIN